MSNPLPTLPNTINSNTTTANFLYSVMPLGGVGEIGHNMTLLETPTQQIIIDIGILFPDSAEFNIQYLIPDFSLLNAHGPLTLILTHGHEDHIGALIHLLKEFPQIKIYASLFTSELIRYKFNANSLQDYLPVIQLFTDGDRLDFGDVCIYPIHVNHSIPQTFGLLIQDLKAQASTFFVSDFKVDPLTPYEKLFNFKLLSSLSVQSPLRVLFADSTNILSQQKSPSEYELKLPISEYIPLEDPKKIFITLFPSNIHRLQTILSLAFAKGKKVIYLGRSMQFYANLAHDLSLLPHYAETLFIPNEQTPNPEGAIYLLSGCQGDFRGAFRRVVYGEDRWVKPAMNDIFIYSAKIIPGNEARVYNLFNKLAELNLQLVTPHDALVHATGHPGEEDLKILYQSYCPTDIIPIHGETYFLRKHLQFAQKNFPHIRGHFLQNFCKFIIDSQLQVHISPQAPLPARLVIENGHIIERTELKKRKKIAQNGLVVISYRLPSPMTPIDPISSPLDLNLQVTLHGLPLFLLDHVPSLIEFLQVFIHQHKPSQELLRITVRKFFLPLLGLKPETIIHAV